MQSVLVMLKSETNNEMGPSGFGILVHSEPAGKLACYVCTNDRYHKMFQTVKTVNCARIFLLISGR